MHYESEEIISKTEQKLWCHKFFNIQYPGSNFMTGLLLVTEVKGKTKFFVPQADHFINRINQANG